jgi:toxin ParE1/3/4
MKYALHPSAEKDISAALEFYLRRSGFALARRFLSEFERVAQLLVEHPGLGAPTTKGRRIFPLRVFPYSVVYRANENGVRIIVVRHQHQKPGFGNART